MTDSTKRFSNRVENYIRYRPSYPKEVIPVLQHEIQLSPSSIIADIGSGTGISTELFLKSGNTVYGVEPNREMREAAERLLGTYKNFHSVTGTAEATTLADSSVDMVLAAQAFHWFDVDKCKKEFARILKPDGWIVLMWNSRRTETTPFLEEYERALKTLGTDYEKVNHRNVNESVFGRWFGSAGFKKSVLYNEQIFDFEGLKGRVHSSSYVPPPGDPRGEPLLAELRRIFDRYQKDNRVVFEYDTEIFFGRI